MIAEVISKEYINSISSARVTTTPSDMLSMIDRLGLDNSAMSKVYNIKYIQNFNRLVDGRIGITRISSALHSTLLYLEAEGLIDEFLDKSCKLCYFSEDEFRRTRKGLALNFKQMAIFFGTTGSGYSRWADVHFRQSLRGMAILRGFIFVIGSGGIRQYVEWLDS